MPLFLGLDTGTSGTKAVLIDETGDLRASDTQEYGLSTPHPQWAEQHPDHDWWRAAQAAIQAVLAKGRVTGDQVGAVGLTGQMHGSVFLNKQQQVLRPALLWCDARTGDECEQITQAAGGEAGFSRSSGSRFLPRSRPPRSSGCATMSRGCMSRSPTFCCPRTTFACA
jgi:xylulokinase